VVDIAAELARDQAVIVKGNHDQALEGASAYLNDTAQAAIDWTRTVLSAAQRRFLADLPLTVRDDDCLFVHASARRPERWDYVDGASAAAHSIAAANSPYTLCGHVHDQRLFFSTLPGRTGDFRPSPGTPVPVPRHRRWLAIAGSVGQPRDADPRAAYALLDTAGERLTFHRVAYDHLAVAEKMRRAGLPDALVYRMQRGI
jgi:diadenosine tetraphosphatase ApaH/serine/threonine PP2A family protein phosphatase